MAANIRITLFDTIDRDATIYVGFLQALVRTSGEGQDATQHVVEQELRNLGCDVEAINYEPHDFFIKDEFVEESVLNLTRLTSVVGRLPGTAGDRSILFFAHPDSEPLTGLDSWRQSPFEPKIEGGRIYGWGVADDLAGIATMTCALKAVLATGLRPRGDVTLASAPSKRHAHGINAILARGHSADAGVYIHPPETGAGLKEVKTIAPGLLRFRVRITGRPADTQEPEPIVFSHLAVNPIEKAWVVYKALQDLDVNRAERVLHRAMTRAIGRSTNLQIGGLNCESGSTGHRMECVLLGTASFPPDEDIRDVQSEIAEAVGNAARQDSWLSEHPPELTWAVGMRGAEIPLAHPLYLAVSHAIVAVTESEPTAYSLHAASEIRKPMLFSGIPTVGFGPRAGDFSQAGHHDEWVDVDDYVRAVKVAALLICSWCGVTGPVGGEFQEVESMDTR